MSEALQRGIMLLGQNRTELAAEEFAKHLATEPNDAHAHGMLAICLADSERYKDATHHAEEAIRLAPDYDFTHYAMAYVLVERERFNEALPVINEAIRLDPYDADYFALLARIHLSQSRHQPALDAANQGLEADAENVPCQNLRAMALKNLGRHTDAAEALEGALARDPENAVTHANKGWALLEKNKHEEALKHFQEALRIDPSLDWAREGIVVALKSRYRIYGVMLKYFLFMSKLSAQQQFMVMIGILFGQRMLGALAKSRPDLAPYISPVRSLLFAFIVFTWVADPLFNLALRLNPYGRLALNEEQKKSSTLVGLCLGLSLLCLLSGFVRGFSSELFAVAAGLGLMVIPVSSIFKCRAGWPRRMMTCYSIALLVALIAMVACYFASDDGVKRKGPLAVAMVISGGTFLAGIIGSSWIANLLMLWRPKK